jgi:hypothetical protein
LEAIRAIQIQGKVTGDSEKLGELVHLEPRGVLTLTNIADVMYLVLNTPIAMNMLSQSFGRLAKRGDVVAHLSLYTWLSAFLELTLTLNSNQGLQLWPVGNLLQIRASTHDPTLYAPVSLADIDVALLGPKMRLYALVQVALIPFQRSHIVIAALNDEATSFFGC